ncbi:amidohydrolase [Pseudomonadota bacterium AL_CKDN230030165-1A_HGKHYDSX7]
MAPPRDEDGPSGARGSSIDRSSRLRRMACLLAIAIGNSGTLATTTVAPRPESPVHAPMPASSLASPSPIAAPFWLRWVGLVNQPDGAIAQGGYLQGVSRRRPAIWGGTPGQPAPQYQLRRTVWQEERTHVHNGLRTTCPRKRPRQGHRSRFRVGPVTSASDRFTIEIEGRGSHASRPQEGVDTLIVGTQIVNALQTIVSRNVHPHESAVVSVTMFHAGETDNVIPQRAQLRGTVRTFNPKIQDLVQTRMAQVIEGIASTYGATARLDYLRDYPVTLNHPEQTAHAVRIARALVGHDQVEPAMKPVMGGEDFSFMLQEKPGAFLFFGNGPSSGLHTPQYDFNDQAIGHGAAFWVRLVQDRTAL